MVFNAALAASPSFIINSNEKPLRKGRLYEDKMIVDFRSSQSERAAISINGPTVERAEDIKHQISDNLTRVDEHHHDRQTSLAESGLSQEAETSNSAR